MRYAVNLGYHQIDGSYPLWIFKSKYETLLPNKSIRFHYQSGVIGDTLSYKQGQELLAQGISLRTPVYFAFEGAYGKNTFTRFLTLFSKNKTNNSRNSSFFSSLDIDTAIQVNPLEELLKISEIDALHAYLIARYSSSKRDFKDMVSFGNGELHNNLSKQCNEKLEGALNELRTNEALAILRTMIVTFVSMDEMNKKNLFNQYFSLLEKLSTRDDYSNAYMMYIVLDKNFASNKAVMKSKRTLIQKDWVANYLSSYLEDEDLKWTGDFDKCECGKMPESYYVKMRDRLAFFRRLTEIPDNIRFTDEYNKLAQAAALANSTGELSHYIKRSRKCYSENAAIGAVGSLINGWAGVDDYMADEGRRNQAVGHRRAILNPYNNVYGIGGTYERYEHRGAGALYVSTKRDSPYTFKDYSKEGVAWPMKGYFPKIFMYERWSYSLDGADFSRARVTLKLNNETIIRPKVYASENGHRLNTLVWEYTIDDDFPESIEVTISAVKEYGKAAYSTITYTVYPFQLEEELAEDLSLGLD